MWKHDDERRAVCEALLRLANLGGRGLWEDGRPTLAAVRYVQERSSPLSHGEFVMLQVVFDVWNGEGHARLDDLFYVLDRDRGAAVAKVLLAFHGGRA